jgi:hypothetical protein
MPISKERQAELMGVAGEQRTKGPRMETKTVQFDGRTGELRMRDADGTLTPVDFPAEYVILKKRNVLKAFTDASYFSTEYDYTSTIISLFKIENGKAKHVGSGTPPELRAEFPFLKWQQPCYALDLVSGEIVKIEIKGASASAFIDYTKKLQDEGLHSYQVVTRIIGADTGKTGAVTYKFMQIESRDLEDDEFEATKAALESVTKQLYEIDKYYAEKKAASAEVTAALPTTAPTGPVAQSEPDPLAKHFDGSEVNPEDIPF